MGRAPQAGGPAAGLARGWQARFPDYIFARSSLLVKYPSLLFYVKLTNTQAQDAAREG